MKTKTIKLVDGQSPARSGDPALRDEAAWRNACRFRVEQLTESVEYYTGQLLERADVEALCRSSEWKVTIVGPKS